MYERVRKDITASIICTTVLETSVISPVTYKNLEAWLAPQENNIRLRIPRNFASIKLDISKAILSLGQCSTKDVTVFAKNIVDMRVKQIHTMEFDTKDQKRTNGSMDPQFLTRTANSTSITSRDGMRRDHQRSFMDI
jgi:hypothetical protein